MTKPGWQLTRGQRLTYSVGMFSTSFVTATVMAWILYFYSPPPNAVDGGMVFLGAGVAVGLARLFGSLVDAITNPLVAFWSDKSTNPKGRRIPFIKRGLLPLVFFAILLWFPPVHGTSHWNVLWLAVTLSGTWFFYTYVVAPYLALMPELTTHPGERVSLTVTMAYWEAGAIVLSAVAIPPLIEAFKGGLQVGPIFLEDGYKVTAIILALIGAVGFLISVSRIRERPLAKDKVTTFNLRQSVVECFRNPAFPPYLLAVASAKIGMGVVMISIPFVATAVLHKGESFVATLFIPLFLSTIIGFVLGEKFVNRVGLKRAFRAATGMATLITIGFFAVTFVGGDELPLQSARDDLPHGDLLLIFAEPDAPAAEIALDTAPRHWSDGARVHVRVPRLEWESLFRTADLEGFHEALEAMEPAAAEALLREDRVETRDLGDLDAKAWLSEQDLGTLFTHLRPDAASLLFTGPKRRYDDGLYAQLPEPLQVDGADGAAVRLPLDVGTLSEPVQAANILGWSRILSTPEERDAEPEAIGFQEGAPQALALQGRLVFSDGSLSFSGFEVAAGDPQLDSAAAAARWTEIRQDAAETARLLARFDLRIELAWSARIWAILFLFLLLGFPAAILMSMYRPIVCEIVDLDEQRCGTRREAIYFGVEGLLTKGADGVAAVVAPAVMILGHWLAPPPLGYMLTFGAAGFFMLLGWWVFKYYPLGTTPDAD